MNDTQNIRSLTVENIGANHPIHKLKAKKPKLSDAAKDFKEKGTEGSLTRMAKNAGASSTMAFAHKEVNDPKASTKAKRKAQWALNMTGK